MGQSQRPRRVEVGAAVTPSPAKATAAAGVLGAAGVALALSGLSRVLSDGLRLQGDDVAVWSHISKHEQRFVQALRASTASEGDEDASV